MATPEDLRLRATAANAPRPHGLLFPTPLLVRATRVGLWALVVVGACSGAYAALVPGGTTPQNSPAFKVSDAPATVVGVAELTVREWLTAAGLETTSGGMTAAPEDGEHASRLDVLSVAAVASRQVGEGYWAVTVAAETAQPTSGQPAGVWFVEVGILDADEGTTAVGTPALVPGPLAPIGAVEGPALGIPRLGDPLAAAAQSFLQAMLAGSGEVARYVAPGVTVAAVDPLLFTTVTVERTATVTDGPDGLVLRVEALAVTPAGVELRPVYEITMQERAGRWEVRALTGAPTLRRADASGSTPATTTTPSTSQAPPAPLATPSPGA